MWIVRQSAPGCLHHVISRFIDREFLVPDDAARACYLKLLGRAMTDSDWRCVAYAVMGNHVHLAMVAGASPAERWLRRVHPPFAAWTNSRTGRIGPVFAGSPAIWVMRPENERRLVSYIHNNPVRAGVVPRARESTWTSHRAYLGLADVPWLATELALARLRITADELDAIVDRDVGYEPVQEPVDRVRRAARKRGGLEVGTPTREGLLVPIMARPFAHLRPDPRRIVEVIAEVAGLTPRQLRSRARNPVTIAGRALVVQCGRSLGLSISSMAATLGISSQRGSVLGLRSLSRSERLVLEVARNRIEQELAAGLRDNARRDPLLRNRKGS